VNSRTTMGQAAITPDVRPPASRTKGAIVTVLCSECEASAVSGSLHCERHLRGQAYCLLERARWPTLTVLGVTVRAFHDAWRQWLRAANGGCLLALVEQLESRRAAL
jgi:hypothetical protein